MKRPNQCNKVLDKLRRGIIVMAAGGRCSERDSLLFAEVLTMRLSLFTDLTGPLVPVYDPEALLKVRASLERTVLGTRTWDVGLFYEDWKVLRASLTDEAALQRGREGVVESLSTTVVHYSWTKSTCLALARLLERDWFAAVNQWVVFDSRLNFLDVDYHQQVVDEYISDESAMQSWDYQPPMALLQEAERMADAFAATVWTVPFLPKHGNGATVEVSRRDATPYRKNLHFSVDNGVGEYSHYRCSGDNVGRWWTDYFYHPEPGLARVSKLECVPKSPLTNRTISKEPTTLQFLQQDLFLVLETMFQRYYNGFINLRDQSASRRMALAGSATGQYDTLDLSKASDSVTLQLMRTLFPGTQLLWCLEKTRSTHVMISERQLVLEVAKFAPMGSAVCFPVECMVFYLACAAAVRIRFNRSPEYGDFRVYGDDICVRHDVSDLVVAILEDLHFKVNDSKSFTCGGDNLIFREACGIEALNGQDITPLRISRFLSAMTGYDAENCPAGKAVAFCDLQNRATLYGYHHLRNAINEMLMKYSWYYRVWRTSLSHERLDHGRIAEGLPRMWPCPLPYLVTYDGTDTNWRSPARWSKGRPARGYFGPSVEREIMTARLRPERRCFDENDLFSWQILAERKEVTVGENSPSGETTLRMQLEDLSWSKRWYRIT